jgi:hypothetical protein
MITEMRIITAAAIVEIPAQFHCATIQHILLSKAPNALANVEKYFLKVLLIGCPLVIIATNQKKSRLK